MGFGLLLGPLLGLVGYALVCLSVLSLHAVGFIAGVCTVSWGVPFHLGSH